MLTFFKTNDPYRLVGIALLLLMIRLPMLISGVPLIEPELKWLVIGEHLNLDNMIMYQDVWDHTAPLSVLVYKWLHTIFGSSRISFQILSILIVFIQSVIFNHVMLKNKAYNHNTYLPALIYMLFMNAYFDFLTLSPVLMSMTFVLLAMNNLFKRMDNLTKDELFIFTGVHLGIATLFFLPSVWFFVVTIISLVLYTGSIARRMMLLIYGYVLTLAFAGLYFYWHDAYLIFQHHFLNSLWLIDKTFFLSWVDCLMLAAVPLLIFIVSIYKIRKHGKYINFQLKIQQVIFMFLLAGIPALMMMKYITTYQFIFFVPGIAFFATHFVLLIRNWIIAEANFVLMFLLVLLNHLFFANNWLYVEEFVSYDELVVKQSEYQKLTLNKKVWVVGDDIRHYQNAQMAMPYLDWQLSKIQLEQLNYFDNSAEVFVNWSKNAPEVIIDQEGVIPSIFALMPTVKSNYIRHESYPEIYLIKD